MNYSQYNEESFLFEYFSGKNDGFLVDIGAADGQTNSNSKKLIDIGWSALLVEPNKKNFDKISELYKDNDKINKENLGCSDETNNNVRFFINKNDEMEQCSTFSEEFSINVKNYYKCEYVETVSSLIKTSELFKKYRLNHIDFLTIDAEGYDSLIIKGIDFNSIIIDLICVENIDEYCVNILLKNEYSLIHKTIGNKFYKKK